jgi:hypothetical protein
MRQDLRRIRCIACLPRSSQEADESGEIPRQAKWHPDHLAGEGLDSVGKVTPELPADVTRQLEQVKKNLADEVAEDLLARHPALAAALLTSGLSQPPAKVHDSMGRLRATPVAGQCGIHLIEERLQGLPVFLQGPGHPEQLDGVMRQGRGQLRHLSRECRDGLSKSSFQLTRHLPGQPQGLDHDLSDEGPHHVPALHPDATPALGASDLGNALTKVEDLMQGLPAADIAGQVRL